MTRRGRRRKARARKKRALRPQPLPVRTPIDGHILVPLRIALTASVLLLTGLTTALSAHYAKGKADPVFTAVLALMTTARAVTMLFGRFGARAASVPAGTPFEVVIHGSPRDTLARSFPLLGVVWGIWRSNYLSTVVALGVAGGILNLFWLWYLQFDVVQNSLPGQRRDELRQRTRRARMWYELDLLIAQWGSGLNMALGLALVLTLVDTLASPSTLRLRALALLSVGYVFVGSFLRAAARSPGRSLWVDVDAKELWRVGGRIVALAGGAATVGAAVGALVGGVLVLANDTMSVSALDFIGRWITAGTTVGSILGVLALPRIAWARQREVQHNARTGRPL